MSIISLTLCINPRKKPWKIREMKCYFQNAAWKDAFRMQETYLCLLWTERKIIIDSDEWGCFIEPVYDFCK